MSTLGPYGSNKSGIGGSFAEVEQVIAGIKFVCFLTWKNDAMSGIVFDTMSGVKKLAKCHAVINCTTLANEPSIFL